jgi:hypothetical protein
MLVVIEVPDHPFGSDHVYEVAPDTGLTLYNSVLLANTKLLPIINAGVAGVAGCALTVATVGALIHPAADLTVTLYVPDATRVKTALD